MKRCFLASIATFAIIIAFGARAAIAGLGGLGWLFADSTSIELRGKTSIKSANGKFCSTLSGKLECRIVDWADPDRKPDYYLLKCDRSRRTCAGTMVAILPSGDPWPTEVEYRTTEWTDERVLAVQSFHRCVVTTLQIDLSSKEALFTETYTKTVKGDHTCIPENIGHTVTYKLENY
jgi:hypothetical protein